MVVFNYVEAARDQITVSEQATAADLFRVFRHDKSLVKVLPERVGYIDWLR